MNIFNRTPAISEDTLQYRLYPRKVDTPDKTSATTLAACIQSFVDFLLPSEFLWHRDSFELKVAFDSTTQAWFFEGRMRVGDCVDDEWCAVWLLREISSKWDLAISVQDTDGEFLLIEAADSLPSWVTPNNSENRVWIYNTQLHLIDLKHVSPPSKMPRVRRNTQDSDDEDGNVEDYLAVDDALKVLRDSLTNITAPSEVTNTIWYRIAQYPSAARNHVHFTKAYIPRDIAKALHVDASLVQKAVETFYTRDAVQLRSAHRMTRFPPNTSVLTTVCMTRTAYAQLVGQKFFPPKAFGYRQGNENTKQWRWRDIGMKIAVGFEMLYQESKGRSDSINRSVEGLKSLSQSIKENLKGNSDYQSYLKKLTSLQYFRGELKGSQLWNELEEKAISIFLHSQKQNEAARPSFAALVSSAISRAPENLSPSSHSEDNDDWLNIDADSFEDMLAKRTNNASNPVAMQVDDPPEMSAEDRVASAQASKLRDLAAKVEEFVEGEGDIEGARFKDELFSDEEMSDPETSEEEENEQLEHAPSLQQRSEQRQADMAKLVPSLDPSEYGKMPASFYSNSQKVTKTTVETDVVTDQDPSASKPSVGLSPSKPIRKPILPRDRYEGVDSDDETDEDEDLEEEDDDKPQVVGEVEIDMGEEEEEFLEFSRQALGISDQQWGSILQDRRDRGAYVPNITPRETRTLGATAPEEGGKNKGGTSPQANPSLDSFEALMKAMDAELRRSTSGLVTKNVPKVGKGKEKSKASVSNDDDDIEAMMAEELDSVLERDEEDDGEIGNAGVDYNLIKNFLESFKSQAGLSGPVSNLAGRLQPDWKLPRDDTQYKM
ncbi:SGT1-domain-containing protein [Marasmius fiardii PR-910]|nr:SGT1-domain-containing protein [Marasmius fiardii PR-910]